MYVWQREDWPQWRWNAEPLLSIVAEARYRQGRFLGTMKALGFDLRMDAELAATCEDVIKTSAIEGEALNPASVRSSIARRLGLAGGTPAPADRKIEGIVDMVLDVTRNHGRPLTAERIFGWHAALFPTGYSGMAKIDVGMWRTDREGPMQVVSAMYGPKPRVHYQAPPAPQLAPRMAEFLDWFNAPSRSLDGLLRAGLAHLWFVTIHPMDDGNGRIARAITDLAIAQTEGTGHRFYAVSGQIEREKGAYYDILEKTQKGDLDATGWLAWFVGCYARAIDAAEAISTSVLARAAFWQAHAGLPPFNDRQQKVLNKLLAGFEGHMTARKWAGINSCSQDTAQRDIADLVQRGLLVRNPGGSRKTSYSFVWPLERHGDGQTR